jgi:ketosteroid isomerase-like protein/Spy/CpxP family protein refolding chaperone
MNQPGSGKPMRLLATFILAAAAGAALAQHRPYAGQHERDIKALSAEAVKQYLDGAGMGYAKPAELNQHPGPAHALELAEPLGLTPEQRAATKRLMDAHRAEARATGAKLVESERALEALFRTGNVDQGQLAEAVRRAADLQGEYRLSHLETHRRLRPILTDEQVARYDQLRGYASSDRHHQHSPKTESSTKSDHEGVIAVSQGLVKAISERDIGAMEKLWAHEPYVTFMGPLSTSIVVGWDGVKKAWEMRFNQFAHVTVSLAESHVHTHGNTAWAVGVEKVRLVRKNGETVSFDAFVTNVFEKRGGRWLMVSHQATPIFRGK